MQTVLTGIRPWGCWTVLGEGEGYKVKRIEVNPGQRLSLQRHTHRSEHWIVVAGAAKITIGERTSCVDTQESTFVPAGMAAQPMAWSSTSMPPVTKGCRSVP